MDTSNKTIMKPKHRFIRLNEVMSRTGYGRTSIYRKMEDGSFPKSLKLGGPPKDPNEFDFILENGFTARWNLDEHGQAWLDIPESINEIGCIHTCQGLEVEYIGVIIGPDLVISGDGFSTNVDARAPNDYTVFGRKVALKRGEITEEDLDKIIRNTYRCLMTRGMKGCYVYCTDPEMNSRFRQLIAESEDSIID